MPLLQRPDEWRLKGIDDLEPAGWEVLRAASNILVAANPGAGKTELLAQRACYLLETGLCLSPRRILALSFKRDARSNLQDRVKRRSGDELARQFDSYTFDGFAKHLLDSFRLGLPEVWKPISDYRIVNPMSNRQRENSVHDLTPADGVSYRDIQSIRLSEFDNAFIQFSFTPEGLTQETPAAWAARQMWLRAYANHPTQLTFPMIQRLAELILSQNPKILRALQTAYSHVFLDEFQDTTWAQYTLLKTAFLGSQAIITAVGDYKQRIMLWAGALEDAFAQYRRDFTAQQKELLLNYRSTATLVWLQKQLIRLIEPRYTPPDIPAPPDLAEACNILTFTSHDEEAETIAGIINTAITEEGLSPRDICVLTRMKTEEYVTPLLEALIERHHIQGRVETALQDILSEPLTGLILATLELTILKPRGDTWGNTVALLRNLRGLEDDDAKLQYLEESLERFISQLGRKFTGGLVNEKEQLLNVCQEIVEFYGVEEFKWEYPQYLQGSYFTDMLKACIEAIWTSFETTHEWGAAIRHFRGDDSVPMMTVHKSKGLEFDTIIFLGLEDGALFSFNNQSTEEKCGFFVALSRAKRRVIFTFAQQRTTSGPYGGPYQTQTRRNIRVLYDALRNAGVPEIAH